MDSRIHIQKAIDYIEDNLKNELDNATLARVAGYSEYHFLRMFKDMVHLTPADYIRKRRISEIVRLIADGRRFISEIAFEYGFNSKENFVRAFKREHHILPTDFKHVQNSLKLYGRLTLDISDILHFELKSTVILLDAFRVVAYKSDEDFPPHFWNKYNVNRWSKKLSGGKTVEDFGVSIWNAARKKMNYYIGIREADAHGDVTDTVTLAIPGGLYAVFETPSSTNFDFVNTIHRTWHYIDRVWLPQNGYRRAGGAEFECYVEENRTFSEKIYIPIIKEGAVQNEKNQCNL